MQNIDILQTIYDAIAVANHARDDDKQIPLSTETSLFGSDGVLDSMELVGLLISIEESLMDEGCEIALSDERAMSQSRSPFRSIGSLKSYIEELLQELSS